MQQSRTSYRLANNIKLSKYHTGRKELYRQAIMQQSRYHTGRQTSYNFASFVQVSKHHTGKHTSYIIQVGKHHTGRQTSYRQEDIVQVGRYHTEKQTLCTIRQTSYKQSDIIQDDTGRKTAYWQTGIIQVGKHHIFEQIKHYFALFFYRFVQLYHFFVSFRENSSFEKHEISRNGFFISRNKKIRFASISRKFRETKFARCPTSNRCFFLLLFWSLPRGYWKAAGKCSGKTNTCRVNFSIG